MLCYVTLSGMRPRSNLEDFYYETNTLSTELTSKDRKRSLTVNYDDHSFQFVNQRNIRTLLSNKKTNAKKLKQRLLCNTTKACSGISGLTCSLSDRSIYIPRVLFNLLNVHSI